MAAHGKDRARTKPNDAKGRVRRGRPKVCMFCAQKIEWVDYKDTNLLRRFITDRGKIKARTNTGTCAQHQRDVALAIKTSRELALLPYLVRTLAADKGGARRGRGPGAGPGGGGRAGERPASNDPASNDPASNDPASNGGATVPDIGDDVLAEVASGDDLA